ncbi:MAG: BON domain-containing protein [Gammaproteobacteria bacterium]|nr:BON domain-containing protein [Gammaproteobacteria bacterium]
MEAADIKSQLDATLEHDLRVNHHLDDIEVRIDADDVILAGEVSTIAAKKLALEAVAGLPGVAGIVDRLHVQPGQTMTDGEIADHLQRALMGDTAFGFIEIHRASADRGGATAGSGQPFIEFGVEDGIVTLDGEVPSLTHKRLAGVFAWWVPGSRDVINGIAVEPPEEDRDPEVLDALRIVLEKDPFLDAMQIRASCENFRITLRGAVRGEEQKQLAESDAWALFAVDDVVNELEVVQTGRR